MIYDIMIDQNVQDGKYFVWIARLGRGHDSGLEITTDCHVKRKTAEDEIRYITNQLEWWDIDWSQMREGETLKGNKK